MVLVPLKVWVIVPVPEAKAKATLAPIVTVLASSVIEELAMVLPPVNLAMVLAVPVPETETPFKRDQELVAVQALTVWSVALK